MTLLASPDLFCFHRCVWFLYVNLDCLLNHKPSHISHKDIYNFGLFLWPSGAYVSSWSFLVYVVQQLLLLPLIKLNVKDHVLIFEHYSDQLLEVRRDKNYHDYLYFKYLFSVPQFFALIELVGGGPFWYDLDITLGNLIALVKVMFHNSFQCYRFF